MNDLLAKSLFFPFSKVYRLTIGCASKTWTQRLAQKGMGKGDWNFTPQMCIINWCKHDIVRSFKVRISELICTPSLENNTIWWKTPMGIKESVNSEKLVKLYGVAIAMPNDNKGV